MKKPDKQKCSPLKRKPLRNPGESLSWSGHGYLMRSCFLPSCSPPVFVLFAVHEWMQVFFSLW